MANNVYVGIRLPEALFRLLDNAACAEPDMDMSKMIRRAIRFYLKENPQKEHHHGHTPG